MIDSFDEKNNQENEQLQDMNPIQIASFVEKYIQETQDDDFFKKIEQNEKITYEHNKFEQIEQFIQINQKAILILVLFLIFIFLVNAVNTGSNTQFINQQTISQEQQIQKQNQLKEQISPIQVDQNSITKKTNTKSKKYFNDPEPSVEKQLESQQIQKWKKPEIPHLKPLDQSEKQKENIKSGWSIDGVSSEDIKTNNNTPIKKIEDSQPQKITYQKTDLNIPSHPVIKDMEKWNNIPQKMAFRKKLIKHII